LKKFNGAGLEKSVKYRYMKLSQYIRGWMNYFGISEYYRPIPEIDLWLRRRMRMCYWKQWRRPRTKIRNLHKLGTSLKAALGIGLSRKGPWRLTRTLATQTGMANKWLKEQGLVSVKERWVNTCPPLEDSLSSYGPVSSVNRPCKLVLSHPKETRMLGGVGRGS